MKRIVHTDKAPEPIGPYNQAVVAGNMLFASGQIALNPSSGSLVTDSIEAETMQVLENVRAVLEAAQFELTDVVKCSIFLSDMSLFAAVNEVYASFFTDDHPARETVAVKGLPMGVNVEISIIAVKA